jgi:hypothetical protein
MPMLISMASAFSDVIIKFPFIGVATNLTDGSKDAEAKAVFVSQSERNHFNN